MGRKLFKIEGPNEKKYFMHGVNPDGTIKKSGAKTVNRIRVIEKPSSKYEPHQGSREQQRRLKKMKKAENVD